MSRRVLEHPGILYCSGCGQELKSEHGTTFPMPTQWIFACTNAHCPYHQERLIVPIRSMVCLTAPQV
jgi:hypothetical protein